MVNQKEMNRALDALAKKKTELSQLDYSDERYDDVEDQLHDLEDAFNEEYGDYLEDVMMDVHDELCPDTDVLLPTAYLSQKYEVEDETQGVIHYKIDREDGVYVDMDDYPDTDTRLLLVPNPTRILFLVNGHFKEEVWRQKEAVNS